MRPFGRWLERVCGDEDDSKRYMHGWRGMQNYEKLMSMVVMFLMGIIYGMLFLLLSGCAGSEELQRCQADLNQERSSHSSFMFRLACEKNPLSDKCLYYYNKKDD